MSFLSRLLFPRYAAYDGASSEYDYVISQAPTSDANLVAAISAAELNPLLWSPLKADDISDLRKYGKKYFESFFDKSKVANGLFLPYSINSATNSEHGDHLVAFGLSNVHGIFVNSQYVAGPDTSAGTYLESNLMVPMGGCQGITGELSRCYESEQTNGRNGFCSVPPSGLWEKEIYIHSLNRAGDNLTNRRSWLGTNKFGVVTVADGLIAISTSSISAADNTYLYSESGSITEVDVTGSIKHYAAFVSGFNEAPSAVGFAYAIIQSGTEYPTTDISVVSEAGANLNEVLFSITGSSLSVGTPIEIAIKYPDLAEKEFPFFQIKTQSYTHARSSITGYTEYLPATMTERTLVYNPDYGYIHMFDTDFNSIFTPGIPLTKDITASSVVFDRVVSEPYFLADNIPAGYVLGASGADGFSAAASAHIMELDIALMKQFSGTNIFDHQNFYRELNPHRRSYQNLASYVLDSNGVMHIYSPQVAAVSGFASAEIFSFVPIDLSGNRVNLATDYNFNGYQFFSNGAKTRKVASAVLTEELPKDLSDAVGRYAEDSLRAVNKPDGVVIHIEDECICDGAWTYGECDCDYGEYLYCECLEYDDEMNCITYNCPDCTYEGEEFPCACTSWNYSECAELGPGYWTLDLTLDPGYELWRADPNNYFAEYRNGIILDSVAPVQHANKHAYTIRGTDDITLWNEYSESSELLNVAGSYSPTNITKIESGTGIYDDQIRIHAPLVTPDYSAVQVQGLLDSISGSTTTTPSNDPYCGLPAYSPIPIADNGTIRQKYFKWDGSAWVPEPLCAGPGVSTEQDQTSEKVNIYKVRMPGGKWAGSVDSMQLSVVCSYFREGRWYIGGSVPIQPSLTGGNWDVDIRYSWIDSPNDFVAGGGTNIATVNVDNQVDKYVTVSVPLPESYEENEFRYLQINSQTHTNFVYPSEVPTTTITGTKVLIYGIEKMNTSIHKFNGFHARDSIADQVTEDTYGFDGIWSADLISPNACVDDAGVDVVGFVPKTVGWITMPSQLMFKEGNARYPFVYAWASPQMLSKSLWRDQIVNNPVNSRTTLTTDVMFISSGENKFFHLGGNMNWSCVRNLALSGANEEFATLSLTGASYDSLVSVDLRNKTQGIINYVCDIAIPNSKQEGYLVDDEKIYLVSKHVYLTATHSNHDGDSIWVDTDSATTISLTANDIADAVYTETYDYYMPTGAESVFENVEVTKTNKELFRADIVYPTVATSGAYIYSALAVGLSGDSVGIATFNGDYYQIRSQLTTKIGNGIGGLIADVSAAGGIYFVWNVAGRRCISDIYN